MTITETKNTIANKIYESKLIERMDLMNVDEIRSEFISILNDKKTSVKESTKNGWIDRTYQNKSKFKLMQMIANLHLAADGLYA